MNAIVLLAFALLTAPPPDAERLARHFIERDSILAESALTLAHDAAGRVEFPDRYTGRRPHPAESSLVEFLESSPVNRCWLLNFAVPESCEKDTESTVELYYFICEELQKEDPDWTLVSILLHLLMEYGCY